MPFSIETKDGIRVDGIPDGVDKNSQELRQLVASLRASRSGGAPVVSTYGAGSPTETMEPQQVATSGEPQTTVPGIAGAVIRGAAPVAGGALAGGALAGPPGAALGAGTVGVAQLVGDPVVEAINKALGTNIVLPSQDIQNLLTRAGVSIPQSDLEKIIQAASAGASGAGGMAALGRSIAGAAPGTVAAMPGEALAAAPAAQIAGGAGAGAASQAAAEAGAPLPVQLAAGLAGGAAGAGASRVRAASPEQQAQTSAQIAAAERSGIVPMTSDVLSPDTFASKWLQSAGEKVPFVGTGPVRASQQEQRVSAVRNLMREYGAEDAAGLPDKIMADLFSKRSEKLQANLRLKNDVIDRMNEKGAVPVDGAIAAIDAEVAKLTSLRNPEVEPVVRMLSDFKASIQNQGIKNIDSLRAILGEAIDNSPAVAGVKDQASKSARAIYGPLKKDMESFIRKNGERRDVAKWMIGNRELAGMMGELGSSALKSALNKGQVTPEVVNNLLFSKKPSDVMTLYRGLSEQGKSNARAALIARAAEKANRADGFSPDAFANEFKKLRTSTGVFFTGEQRKQVDGLIRALEMTKRAAGASVSPPTGQQAVPILAVDVMSGALGGPMGATVAAGTVGLMARAFESPSVRNILVKIPATKRGSKEETALVNRLVSIIQTRPQIQQEQE